MNNNTLEDSRREILSRDFSTEFVAKMQRAIETSHYKYGWMSDTYPELAQAVNRHISHQMIMSQFSGCEVIICT